LEKGRPRGRPFLSESIRMDPEPDQVAAPQEFDVAVQLASIPSPEVTQGLESPFDDVPPPEALESGSGEGSDPSLEFRRTLGMFATGVTVITTLSGEQVHGMTANAFMSVSLQPPLILISFDRRARMNGLLREGVRYGVSVLEEQQTALSDRFAGRTVDGGAEPAFEIVRETPLVEGALAHLVARVVRSYWGGDHSLFLGQVEYVRYGEGTPLLFHSGRYERVKRDQPALSELPGDLLEPIVAFGTERTFAEGELLMERGEGGVTMYLILEGQVRVERPGRVVRMGPGDLVGEIEVLNQGGGRIADVVADGQVRAIAVAQDDLRDLLEAHPKAAWALLGVLASRFRENA
jgi:flavin reductase (DIM6/NTAB) family NADH-FMN oxidoreductase RutF